MNNANPQLPTKLNFLVCCVAGGRPPSPPERNVDGRGESSMKFFFFSGHAFGTNFACKGGGDTTSSFEAQKIKKLTFVGGGCIFLHLCSLRFATSCLQKCVAKHDTQPFVCATNAQRTLTRYRCFGPSQQSPKPKHGQQTKKLNVSVFCPGT